MRDMDKKKLSDAAYRAANMDKIKAYRAKWHADHLESEKERARTKYRANPHISHASSRLFQINNPESVLVHRARQRAKAKGLTINITKDDIFIPDICPILGIVLARCNGKHGDSSPSLDRINNNLGYVKGNVAVISHKANNMKGNSDVNTIRKLLAYMTKTE